MADMGQLAAIVDELSGQVQELADLCKEREDRIKNLEYSLDAALGKLYSAQTEAAKWRDLFAAEIDERPGALPLPWESK